ncbi:MAG: ABC transporter transmembrane domain-containing protein, partial [Pseudomonadota bacterium]
MKNTPAKGKISELKQLKHYLIPYKIEIIGALIALILTSSSVLGIGGAIRYMIDEGIGRHDEHLLNLSYMLFIGITFLLAAATYARYFLISSVGEKVISDIRRDFYSKVIRLDQGFFETTSTGDILSVFSADTTFLQTLVGSSISVALRNVVLFIGGGIMLFKTSPHLAFYILLIVPIVIAPIVVIGRKVRVLSRGSQDRLAKLNGHMEETIFGIRTIRAFSLEQYEENRFFDKLAQQLFAASSYIKMRASLTAFVIAFVFSAIVTVLWIGGKEVMQGNLSSGSLSAFIFYAVVVAGAVGAISEVFAELQRAAGATERIMEIMSRVSNIVETSNPIILPENIKGNIAFNDVNFNYPARKDIAAVENLNLSIAGGETIALVGPSGAGKTTLFRLLLRFYDPISGNITIDGVDIKDLTFRDLRSHMAIVQQDPAIFSANAWDNIRCGKQDATAKEVIIAAEAASALEFLEKLPDGLDT